MIWQYIIPPVLVTIGAIITWFLKSKKEELIIQEERNRNHKLKIYEILLNPIIAAFTNTISEKEKQKEINKMLSLEYKKTAFNLTTFGDDQVVKSYNKIMQEFFRRDERVKSGQVEDDGNSLIFLMADLLLNIRKDLYGKNTKLKRAEMLEFMLTDIEKHRDNINSFK